jgi:hypothetical protein
LLSAIDSLAVVAPCAGSIEPPLASSAISMRCGPHAFFGTVMMRFRIPSFIDALSASAATSFGT